MDDAAAAAVAAARSAGASLWRISSTAFTHLASDATLAPLGRFVDAPGAAAAYPPVLVGHHVAAELRAIALSAGGEGEGGPDGGDVAAAM